MPEKKLAEVLSELHESLTRADEVDTETREQLKTLLGDIQRILGDPENRDAGAMEPVMNDLQSVLLRLETEHPYSAGLLNRLAEGLASLGI